MHKFVEIIREKTRSLNTEEFKPRLGYTFGKSTVIAVSIPLRVKAPEKSSQLPTRLLERERERKKDATGGPEIYKSLKNYEQFRKLLTHFVRPSNIVRS